MLTISAAPYRATLADTPIGVEVIFYERCHSGAPTPYRLTQREVIDAPFHVVADKVHDLLTAMRRST